jgi:hypothetical protein
MRIAYLRSVGRNMKFWYKVEDLATSSGPTEILIRETI